MANPDDTQVSQGSGEFTAFKDPVQRQNRTCAGESRITGGLCTKHRQNDVKTVAGLHLVHVVWSTV